MKFFTFHLMPFNKLPEDFGKKYETAWTWVPNSLYDPVYGHELYNRFLDELVYAEEVGFDGVCVNEHHQSRLRPYAQSQPDGIDSGSTDQACQNCSDRQRFAILQSSHTRGRGICHDRRHLGRTLDCRSGRGGGPEYNSFSMNPTHARGMFQEAMDLVIRAWTEPGPFEHYGKHWKLKYVNPWPTPYQKPHPPIWIPGAGSKETIDLVAERRYGYMGIPYFHRSFFKRTLKCSAKPAKKMATKLTKNRRAGWFRFMSPRPTSRLGQSMKNICSTSSKTCSKVW